jgi:leader peptidase (prepilin peptidase) / N-methyltransferase
MFSNGVWVKSVLTPVIFRTSAVYLSGMDTSFLVLLFFVFGLVIGSFLNVLVYRLKESETILGRSFCRGCHHQIRWYDNIPLFSFLVLRGRCRDCQATISWQYPALEAVMAFVFAAIGMYFFSYEDPSSWLEVLWLMLVTSCFVTIAAYDMRHMEIPIVLVVVSAIATVAFFAYTYRFDGIFLSSRLGLGLMGAVAVGAFFFALVYASHETWMGWGDVWLGCVAGLIVGLPFVLFMLTVSFASGSIIGIAGMYLERKSLKSKIPFGPFLVIGTAVALFFPVVFPEYAVFFLL